MKSHKNNGAKKMGKTYYVATHKKTILDVSQSKAMLEKSVKHFYPNIKKWETRTCSKETYGLLMGTEFLADLLWSVKKGELHLTPTSFEIHIHYKQGDDLAYHLSRRARDKGLELWEKSLMDGAKRVTLVRNAIKGHRVEISADTHSITFIPRNERAREALLKVSKKAGLIPCL